MTLTAGLLLVCGGFLLAVLWMDLIFDSQTARPRNGAGPLDDSTLNSIAGYYRRATTTSQPMGLLVALAMVVLLASLGAEAISGRRPGWLLVGSAVLAGGSIALAALRTVPNAVRLGKSIDSVEVRSVLARAVYRDHLLCAAAMAAFVTLWLVHLGR